MESVIVTRAYDGSCVMFDMSGMEAFQKMPYYDEDGVSVFEKYWGLCKGERMCTSEIHRALKNFRIDLQEGMFGVHPGALAEMCQYFKIPYPGTEIKEHQSIVLNKARCEGSCQKQKQNIGLKFIEKLEAAIETLIPLTMQEDDDLKAARLGSVVGILQWEIMFHRFKILAFLE